MVNNLLFNKLTKTFFVQVPTTALTTAKAPPITTAKPDCLYDLIPDVLDKDTPYTFVDGTTAELTDNGGIKYTFPEPRDVTEVTLQALDTTDNVVIVAETLEGVPPEETPVDGLVNQPMVNPVYLPDVISVTIKRDDDSPFENGDIIALTIEACEES